MRVLLISTPSSLHTRTWLTELRNHGVEVDLLYIEEWIDKSGPVPEELYSQARLLRLPGKAGLLRRSLSQRKIGNVFRDLKNRTRIHQSIQFIGPEIARVFHEGGYDIVHCHGISSALLLAEASGVHPYSGTAWGSDIHIQPYRNPYMRPLISRALEGAAFIHVESERSASRVLELAPSVGERLFISTWGVDTTQFVPGLAFKPTRDKYNIPNQKYVLSFRVLGPLYRIDTILHAFSRVLEKVQDLILIIASDGPEKQQLEALARELQIANSVYFTGFVDNEDKRALLSNAEVYVQFPKSDGVAISAMEAMSSGLPIISSDVGEASVLISEGDNGILVAGDDSQTLANAILKV
ncbi:MAG: glycosyltransferase family 4 protein, partial [Candidatus Thorarchaeota archaeon]